MQTVAFFHPLTKRIENMLGQVAGAELARKDVCLEASARTESRTDMVLMATPLCKVTVAITVQLGIRRPALRAGCGLRTTLFLYVMIDIRRRDSKSIAPCGDEVVYRTHEV
jgi:hypothetical protein